MDLHICVSCTPKSCYDNVSELKPQFFLDHEMPLYILLKCHCSGLYLSNIVHVIVDFITFDRCCLIM